jgi:ATP-dependent RNA helicase DHX8/PRP22
MDDLEQLELLSLVSKVTSEINNYMGVSDKTIAEFVIAEYEKCSNLKDFQAKLEEYDFPGSLAESIDRLINNLHPKYKNNGHAAPSDAGRNDDGKSQKFKGLSIPDKAPPAAEAEGSDGEEDGLGDTFALLESMAGPPKAGKQPQGNGRKRSISPERERDDRSSKRYRRSRSRSRSPRRKERRGRERNDDFLFEDEYGRTRPHRPWDKQTTRVFRSRA